MSLDQIIKVDDAYQSKVHDIIASLLQMEGTVLEEKVNEPYNPLVTNIVVSDHDSSSTTASSDEEQLLIVMCIL